MSMNISTTPYGQNYYNMVGKNDRNLTEKAETLEDLRNPAGKTNSISQTNEAKLSGNAQKFLENLRKQYGDLEFMVGNRTDDLKTLAKSGTKEFSVIFSNAEIERMANDEKYAAERMKSVQGAIRMSEAIEEKYGRENAFGEQNGDVTISKIAISFEEDGSTRIFAELEKMSKQQRENIEASRENRAEEKKASEKRAVQQEKEPVKRTVVSASSMDELFAKIREIDWSKVKEENSVGSRFDFSI